MSLMYCGQGESQKHLSPAMDTRRTNDRRGASNYAAPQLQRSNRSGDMPRGMCLGGAGTGAYLDALGEVGDRGNVGEVVGPARLALALERDPPPVRPQQHLRVVEEVHLRRRKTTRHGRRAIDPHQQCVELVRRVSASGRGLSRRRFAASAGRGRARRGGAAGRAPGSSCCSGGR